MAYFQSKINNEVSPYCRLCNQKPETLSHLITDCEAMTNEQLEIMENKIPLPDMKWSTKRILRFIQAKKIESLMDPNTEHTQREIIYI